MELGAAIEALDSSGALAVPAALAELNAIDERDAAAIAAALEEDELDARERRREERKERAREKEKERERGRERERVWEREMERMRERELERERERDILGRERGRLFLVNLDETLKRTQLDKQGVRERARGQRQRTIALGHTACMQ